MNVEEIVEYLKYHIPIIIKDGYGNVLCPKCGCGDVVEEEN